MRKATRFVVWNADKATTASEIFNSIRLAYRECARLEAAAGDHFAVVTVPA